MKTKYHLGTVWFTIGYWHWDSLNVVVWMVVVFVFGIEAEYWSTPVNTTAVPCVIWSVYISLASSRLSWEKK